MSKKPENTANKIINATKLIPLTPGAIGEKFISVFSKKKKQDQVTEESKQEDNVEIKDKKGNIFTSSLNVG
jgi:hypothetical protein